MNEQTRLVQKIYSGSRITPEEALLLFDLPLPVLGAAADARRAMRFSENTAGFIIDRIINFTNICSCRCAFCAFHAEAGQIKPYTLPIEAILTKAEELAAAHGTQIMLQGGLNPHYGLAEYAEMTSALHTRFPLLHLHSFSPAEIVFLSRKEKRHISDILTVLKNAGLASLPGASDLLVARIRTGVSPDKLSVDEWCDVIRAAADCGLTSSATMTYGMGETLAERIEHLRVVRTIQDETGIINAFIPWSFSPCNTKLSHIPRAGTTEYLKIVAAARIFLDNVPHLQAGWLTEGLAAAQCALAFGADDMGGVLTEELVVKASGGQHSACADDFISIIKNAGKIPVQRDTLYREVKRFA